MKIAIISARFPPKWLAGTELASYFIAKNLAKNGNEIHVITSWDQGIDESSNKDGFILHRIKYKKIKFIWVLTFIVKSINEIIKMNPDIVHSQSIYTGMPGIFAKFFMKKPCVVWAQGSDVYYSKNLTKVLMMFIINQSTQLISLTNDMKNEIEKFAKKEVIILPNGIDLSIFEKERLKSPRNETILEPHRWLLLFVGSLSPVKGLSYLIHAIHILISRGYENINLTLVGDGENRQYLENQTKKLSIEKNITFIGQISNDKVPYYMMHSDIFVLPSLSEGFPLVILEAMASGLPIITTKVRGLPEIVIDRENGLLVESRSADDLANKILEIMHDDELRQKIAKNNIEKSYSYSWDVITDKLYNIYLSNVLK